MEHRHRADHRLVAAALAAGELMLGGRHAGCPTFYLWTSNTPQASAGYQHAQTGGSLLPADVRSGPPSLRCGTRISSGVATVTSAAGARAQSLSNPPGKGPW